MAMISGPGALVKVCEALGISLDQKVTKIVLEFSVNYAARVYVQRLLDVDQEEKVLGIIRDCREAGDAPTIVDCKDLGVNEKGEVRHS
jgi:ACT domain-containing protein